jgi:hypothetical protein
VSDRPPSSPELRQALRLFCLGCFFDISRELDGGASIEVDIVEHRSGGQSGLFEYDEKIGAFIAARADRLLAREDAVRALAALKLEPATGLVAQGHLERYESEDDALRRGILLPLLVDVGEDCQRFDWSDAAFENAYRELETRLFGNVHHYRAIAPLVGLTARDAFELGCGTRVRHTNPGELDAAAEAEALPLDFGREYDRQLVLEIEIYTHDSTPPDAPAIVARAVSTLRLTIPGALAAGPGVVEYLDGHLYGLRQVGDITSRLPTGEPTRLDQFRGRIAGEVFRRLSGPADDPELLEALDRWELALFHQGPLRAEGLREALVELLGGDDGAWAAAMRASALVGETPDERAQLLEGLVSLVEGNGPGAQGEEVLRRALVAAVRADSRSELMATLDNTLLGVPAATAATDRRALPIRELLLTT